MSSTHAEKRSRDADRSRATILDAAETLFAAAGYDATTVQDVARAAGLSRETPRYFFGSKEQLYEAVLARLFEVAGNSLVESYRNAATRGRGRDAIVRRTVAAYFDFLAEHPNFVRLVEWEALGGGRFLGASAPHTDAVLKALTEVNDEFAPASAQDGVQLLLSIIGLCWVTFTHGHTLLPALGLDPRDPRFLEARKEHVVELLLNGIGSRSGQQRQRKGEGDAR